MKSKIENKINSKHLKKLTQERLIEDNAHSWWAWLEHNCWSVTQKEAGAMLGYRSKSDGLMIQGVSWQQQFKPDKPFKLNDFDKKAPKYLTPKGDDYDAIVLKHPTDNQYWNIKNLKENCYQIDGKPYLLLTEGFFTGLAPQSYDIPTVILLGVEMGLTSSKNDPQGKRYLVPTLEKYAKEGFGFIIGFDADLYQNRWLKKALVKLASQLQKFDCDVRVLPKWDLILGKGLDDYIMNNGIEAFRQHLISRNISFQQWKEENYQEIDYSHPDLVDGETVEAVILRTLFKPEQWAVFDDTFYQYTGSGYWQKVPDVFIYQLITEKLKHCYILQKKDDEFFQNFCFTTEHKKQSVFKFVRSNLAITQRPYNEHLVAFLNCTVDLRTGEILEHDPQHYLTNAIPTNYHSSGECPQLFKKFIAESYGLEQLNLIRAVTSMFLDPTAPYGKFPHLIGQSGGGKGVLLRLWASLFSNDHVRSFQGFGDISTAEGRHQYLTDTRFYYFPDVGGYMSGLRAFYELVDNGAMSGRALFSSQGYQKQWNTRFAIASVEYLQIENSGDGWKRRCIPIPVKTAKRKEDPTLLTRLQEHKAQIIAWALAMDKKERDLLLLSSENWSQGAKQASLEQDIYSDSIRAFIDLCLRPSQDEIMENYNLYDLYKVFCQSNGFVSLNYKKFLAHFKNVLPHHFVDRKSYRENGVVKNRKAHFANISAIPNLFINVHECNEERSQNILKEINPQWVMNRSLMAEGGLLELLESDFENCNDDYCTGNSENLSCNENQNEDTVTPSKPDIESNSAKNNHDVTTYQGQSFATGENLSDDLSLENSILEPELENLTIEVDQVKSGEKTSSNDSVTSLHQKHKKAKTLEVKGIKDVTLNVNSKNCNGDLSCYNDFPHLDSDDLRAKRNKAIQVKTAILNCGNKANFEKLREEFPDIYISWVWQNLLTSQQKLKVKELAKIEQTSLFDQL